MEESASKKIGEYIKRLRKESKVSARELGSFVGYSQSYISALENNVNKNTPSKQVLDKIASALTAVGYNRARVTDELYSLAGYTNPFEKGNKELMESIYKNGGYYDNLSGEFLEKPYLNLSYLLETDGLDLMVNFYHRDLEHSIFLDKGTKHFIKEMLLQLLIKDGIQEDLEKLEEEYLNDQAESYNENREFIETDNILSLIRHLLSGLYDLQKNYSDDKFKSFYHNQHLHQYLRLTEEPSDADFTKENLDSLISQAVEYIAKLESKLDDMKED